MSINLEKFTLGYSYKNIPLATKTQYKMKLIDSINQVIRSMRWKALFTLRPETKAKDKECYGFKSSKAPPVIKELRDFEEGLVSIAGNIKFKEYHSEFLTKLDEDYDKIKKEDRLVIKADKTSNLYKVNTEDYNRIVMKAVNKDYKKADADFEGKLVKEEKKLASEIGLEERIEKLVPKEAFGTFKDHKDGFLDEPKIRLLNPTKTSIGKIAKVALERVVKDVRDGSDVNLWRNSAEVVRWFKNLPNKRMSFIGFDVVEFYPSINESLLDKAINWSKSISE